MKTNKILLIIVVMLAAMSVMANIVWMFIAPNMGVVIGTWAGLGSLIVLSGLACYWSRTMTSLYDISDRLKDSDAENLYVKSTPAIETLLDSIRQFSSDAAEKTVKLQKQTADFNLELQLLRREKTGAESIIHSIRDAVIVTDDSDRLVIANPAAETLFGFEMDASTVRSAEELIKDEDFIKLIRQSRQSKQLHARHEVSFEDDDQGRIFDSIMSCVKDSNSQITGVVIVLHDITREKEISQMKNDFVSHVSHELKTPLASINAYAEMLVDGEAQDQETIKDFCNIIQSQAQRLNRLIEEILNISRIESGIVKVNKECFSVAIVIQEAAKMIESYAAEKNITVNVPAPIIHDQVNADKDMMNQVIINLLSNAVKYTQEGGTITVESQVDESDQMVHVTVEDTGVGIPPEDVGHVFDKFYRVEANKKYAKGTGLGLNLVQQIIEKVHDGRVFVKSAIGHGSTFGFDVPLAVSQVEEPV